MERIALTDGSGKWFKPVKAHDALAAKKLKQYNVNVVRTGYSHADIKVEARNEKEAKRLALEKAGNLVFSEHDADYDVEFVEVKQFRSGSR